MLYRRNTDSVLQPPIRIIIIMMSRSTPVRRRFLAPERRRSCTLRLGTPAASLELRHDSRKSLLRFP
jgi:hypothetical protein